MVDAKFTNVSAGSIYYKFRHEYIFPAETCTYYYTAIHSAQSTGVSTP